jgi:hypothetical protein
MKDAVRVYDEPADASFAQDKIEAVNISAFREPDAGRVTSKTTSVMVAGGKDLSSQRWRMIRQERQEGVGRGAGDDFESTDLLKFAERSDEIPAIGEVGPAQGQKPFMVHPGQRLERLVPMRPMKLVFCECNQAVQMTNEAVLEKRVQQHRTESGRQGKGKTGSHAVPQPSVEGLNQGQVSLDDRFEEPVLFEEPVMFRMTHKGQMRVEDERKVAGARHGMRRRRGFSPLMRRELPEAA